jgi:PAS domain S-box-containing protein
MIKKLILLSFIIFSSLFSNNLITKSESNYLSDRKYLSVYVAKNIEPLQFIGNDEKYRGVDIDLIKIICKNLGIKPIFYSEKFKKKEADIFTSISKNEFELDNCYHTNTIYQINNYVLFHNFDESQKEIKNIYLASTTISQKLLQKKYPKADIYVSKMFKDSFYKFKSDKSSILVYNNFNSEALKDLSVKNKEHYFREELFAPINVEIYVRNKNTTLLNILQREIYILSFNNEIVKIFDKWTNFETVKINILSHKKIILYLTVVNLLILVIFILLRLYYNRNFKRFIKIINDYKSKEDNLVHSLEEKDRFIERGEEHYNDFLDNIYSIIIRYDLNGNILYANKQIESILNYQSNKIIGKNLLDFFPENVANELISAFGRTYDSDESKELTLLTAENLEKIFEYKFIFSENNAGDIIINCLLKDVTETKQLQMKLDAYNNELESMIQQRTARLKQSEQRFKSVVEATSDGIVLLDRNKFLFANKAFLAISGYTKNEIFHGLMRFSHLIHKDTYNKLREYFFAVTKLKNKEYKIETSIVNKNLEEILCEITFTSAFYLDREVLLGIIRDITVKKMVEKEKLAKEKLMTITQLSVTTNDRINSPLMTIQGYIELLQKILNDDNQKVNRILRIMNESVEEISSIMGKLQSLNKIIYKDYKLENEVMLDLDNILEEKGDNRNGKNDR